VVLAPHPDDESLGCGGLVALKRELGVPVTVVFMTDGSWSHAAFVEPAVLADRRRREARAACARLGVAADEVHFLDFRDGNLAAHVDEAVARLDPILRSARATQVILPHPAERPSDHAATFFVAEHCVAQRLRTDYDALLYPVWLWDQWPFTNPWSAPRARTTTRAAVRTAVEHRLGLGLARSLRWRVDITPVLGRKQAALDAHTSQMVRPPDAPDWLTLADVSGGDWLDLLVRPVELYGAVALRGARPAGTRAGGAP
jgi:LmbE family N-acetylglucosaminyl deacetylase